VQCSACQQDCCTGTRVPLTDLDVDRILRLGYRLEEVAQAYAYPPAALQDNELWWQESMVQLFGHSYRITTRKNEAGRCVFLEPGKGCKLGAERPDVCKIFPFWVDAQGRVVYEPGDQSCYMEKLQMPVDQALPRVSESEQSVRGHFSSLQDGCQRNRGERYRDWLLSLLFTRHQPPNHTDFTPPKPCRLTA
jgi:Fe-S-cluster containining protein